MINMEHLTDIIYESETHVIYGYICMHIDDGLKDAVESTCVLDMTDY